MKIALIRTGGTIGAEPYGETSPAFATMAVDGTIVCDTLKDYFPDAAITDIPLMNMDSQLLTAQDRASMAKAITKLTDADLIVLTHGTDTMRETALSLADVLQTHFDMLENQGYAADDGGTRLARPVVVITGSMQPLSNGPESDAHANFAFLQQNWQHLPPLSVVMHGASFDPRGFIKVKQEEPYYFAALRADPRNHR